MTRRTVFALAVLLFVFLLLILTNDTYHLVWTDIWSDSIVHVVHGPVAWGAIFYAYFLSMLNLMVLARLFAHWTRHRWMAVGHQHRKPNGVGEEETTRFNAKT